MVLPSLPRAGMEQVAAALARGLAARGHDAGITCIESAGELGEALREEGVRVSVVPTPGVRSNFARSPLAAWLRERRPDVVHAHNGAWLKAATAARAAGVPRTVFTHHGLDTREPWYMRPYTRLAARRTHRIAAVSEALRDHLVGRMGLPAASVEVVRNGIDTARFRSGPRAEGARARLGVPAGRRIVGNVARLEPVKDHDLLLRAFALLRERVPDAFLLLVGDGSLREAVEARAAALGLRGHLRITGIVPDPAPIYREMAAFALSSVTEGTSISILEAMASGVPVAATAVGGNPALVGGDGLLVPHGDARRLAEALHRLLEEPELAARLSAAARRRVEAEYGRERMLDRYEELYGARAARCGCARSPGAEVAACAG